MADIYLTVAEIYQMQHILIETFGGLHGVGDKNAVEAATLISGPPSADDRARLTLTL